MLIVTTLALRRVVVNRHVHGRLFASSLAFAAALAIRVLLQYVSVTPELRLQLGLVQPLLIAFGFIIAFVALTINPWRVNRLPDRFPTIVQDVLAIALLAVAAVVILQDKILATTAVGAVVIGFALQDTLGNLFAGLAIQIEKPFRVGQWVNLAGKDGLVSEITWRATKIRTKSGNFVVVPNSVLSRDTITNYSEPTADTRFEVEVGASYDSPPNTVKAVILEAVKDEPLLAPGKPIEILVTDFAASSITYRIRVWTTDFTADERLPDRVRSSVYYAFRRNGIEIPYPIRVQIPRRPIKGTEDVAGAEQAMRAVEIFAALSDEEHEEIARLARSRLYAAGEAIVREGDAGSSMFVLTRGETVVTVGVPGREVARHRPGSFFGEMSLLTGAPRTATVTAVGDCEMLEITADAFRRVVLANPAAVEHVGTAVATRAGELARLPEAGSSGDEAAEQPASFVARAMRFLRLSAPVLILALAWPGRVAAADSTILQLAAPDGRRTVTAVDSAGPIVVDGVLDEAVWRTAQPAADFVQAEPHEGQPATERTEVRVAFDGEAIYIGVVCHDDSPAGLIVNDIRKDFTPGEQDSFEVLLDTFADRRNGFVFAVNAAGAKSDTQIANEGRDVNTSWDAVWSVATRIGPDGWTAEIRIPFKTLRFERGTDRIWGVNFSRRVRRKNEIDYWSAVPRVYNLYRASLAGTLAGLPDASQGRNLRIKPWVAADTTRSVGGSSFEGGGHVGLDAKYGVTPSLTLDVTVRPDFAQAEADEQQVNLTQFSLFFPEKREFFLENSGTFYFGDIPRESRLGNVRFAAPEEEMLLFFSRRIGLTSAGQAIPIDAGGRLTGRAGAYGVGVMTIQTESADGSPGDNYTVLRARRDVLGASDVGAIFLSRQSTRAGDYNRVYGADANFRFYRALSLNGFLTKSETPGLSQGDLAGKGSVSWNANFLHAQYSFLTVGDHFRDDVGFIKRTGIRKHFVDFGVRPRPAALRRFGIRELHPHTRYNIYTDQSNVKLTHTNHVGMSVFLDNGGNIEFAVNPRFERLVTPFAIRPDQSFATGTYRWTEYNLIVETNHSRALSASLNLTTGGFWTGTQKSTQLGFIVRPSYHLTFDTALQRNDIDLPFPMHAFVTNLVTSRINYAFNTRTFLDTLLQYNTDLHQFSANVRFDLIHRPLSDLFIVFNEQRLTDSPTPIAPGRGLIAKYTHMLTF